MNNSIQSILTLIVLVIAFAFAIHFSHKHKPHPWIMTVVLLLFLTVITSELCWIVLSCINNDISIVTQVMDFLEATKIMGEFLLDILVISSLVVSKKGERHKTEDGSLS